MSGGSHCSRRGARSCCGATDGIPRRSRFHYRCPTTRAPARLVWLRCCCCRFRSDRAAFEAAARESAKRAGAFAISRASVASGVAAVTDEAALGKGAAGGAGSGGGSGSKPTGLIGALASVVGASSDDSRPSGSGASAPAGGSSAGAAVAAAGGGSGVVGAGAKSPTTTLPVDAREDFAWTRSPYTLVAAAAIAAGGAGSGGGVASSFSAAAASLGVGGGSAVSAEAAAVARVAAAIGRRRGFRMTESAQAHDVLRAEILTGEVSAACMRAWASMARVTAGSWSGSARDRTAWW